MRHLASQSLVVVLMVLIAVVGMTGNAAAEIKFGILPRLSTEVLYGMFKPLAEYLTKETGEKVSIVIPKDFSAFKEAVASGQVDFGFANPLIYVQMKKNTNIQPMALSVEAKGGKKFRGIIIARSDSGIRTVQDLKGKKLIAVEKDSPAGYIFQKLQLSKAGVDISKDAVMLPFAMKHDKVTQAVFSKEADAGFIREDDLEKMKNKVDLSQIKIIAYTEYMPNWPIFATPKIDKAVAAKIKAALLRLDPDNAQSGRVLMAASLKGFTPVADNEYDLLRKAAKSAGAF